MMVIEAKKMNSGGARIAEKPGLEKGAAKEKSCWPYVTVYAGDICERAKDRKPAPFSGAGRGCVSG
ncbi:hypothetical protein C4F51_02865 [Cellvibrio sp. KB43]|uniref:Uncharacterized protein n=1 Tax=Cellvibrio polysaccharolyticus TaxID=2082724 RepID=A0A928UZU7_9GAMM|nr:hypothetical protein [Cellvibrio polysaccharolyticus]